MNRKVRAIPTLAKSPMELASKFNTLLKVSPNLESVKVVVPFQGQTFTVATAELTLPDGKVMIGEGVSRKSTNDLVDPNVGKNKATKRALESLDKQLRRPNHLVGHRFEG